MQRRTDSHFYLADGYSVIGVDANPDLIAAGRTRFEDATAKGTLTLVSNGLVGEAADANSAPETLRFYRSKLRSEWSSFDASWGCRNPNNTPVEKEVPAHCERIDVPVTTCAGLIERFGKPLYMKIDIEGRDTACLNSLHTLPRESRPTYVSVENVNEAHIDLLAALGYTSQKAVDQRVIHARYMGQPDLLGNSGPFGDAAVHLSGGTGWVSAPAVRALLPLPERHEPTGEGMCGGSAVGAPVGPRRAARDAAATSTPSPAGELLLVVVLCRHGARSPLYTFPGDVRPLDGWGVGAGGLTAAGAAAHYALGTRLRARYVDTGFLSPTWNATEVYVRSTAIDRALLSAYAQMAGLYAAKEGGVGPAAGVLLPPAVHPHLLDVTLPRALRLPPGVAVDIPTVAAVNDVWTASAAAGLPLPDGVTADDVTEVRAIADGLLAASVAGAEVQRLRSGVLLRALRDRAVLAAAAHAGRLPAPLAGATGAGSQSGRGHVEAPVAGPARFSPRSSPPSPRYVLYSAHDTTLAAALAALGAFDGTNPPGASRRLRPKPADYSVRVEYNGLPVTVRGCDAVDCPLPLWVAGTASRVLDTDLERVVACATGVRRVAAALASAVGVGPAAAGPAEGGGGGELRPDSVVVLDGHDGWRRVALPLAGQAGGGGGLRAALGLVALGAGGCLLVATALALVRRHKATAAYGPIGEGGTAY
ncbi:hypothetical protein I4F81_012466 [Pyropia yezoensis]|uniref:Uncharacterized protein n=1 Tax=Pyropia yezoensis TaxID=2788 RepID=A0ACC3CII4_PYRYE|nr:hypothetical protein I4F81_012466 [Neopyropia yezoensis]